MSLPVPFAAESSLAATATALRAKGPTHASSVSCVICGGPGATPRLTAGGATYGTTCPHPTCVGLSWELWFHRETGALAEHEMAEVRWQVDQRRAEVAGQVFCRPPPRSHAERRLDARVAGGLRPENATSANVGPHKGIPGGGR